MSAIICFLSGNGKITVVDAVTVKIAHAKLGCSLISLLSDNPPEISFCFLHI
jgi:hypothetical protein